MRFQRSAHRALLGLTTLAVAAGTTFVGPAEAATSQARASSDWLTTQLTDGLVQSEYNDGSSWVSYTDHGLTLDFFFAFDRLEVRPGVRQDIISAMEPETDNYVRAFGTEYAGALGKLVTALQENGTNVGTYADGELLNDLEDRVVTSGPEQGRAKDDGAGADTSNTFGQSYVVTALAEADSGLEDSVTRFLVDQQCDAGFFRESMSLGGFSCDDGTSEPSVDGTGTAVSALLAAAPDLRPVVRDEARAAAAAGVRWLVQQQRADGSITGGRDSNSTGLAATALLDAGRGAKAAAAARWVEGLRVTSELVRTTAFRARDLGAVAYDVAQLQSGKQSGIARADRYVWRRATAQAAPALDAL